MRYKQKTLSKYRRNARTALRMAIDRITHEHVVISKGNRKIGKVMNVSTLPIICCGNCAKCKNYCYDIKACMQYKNVMHARAVNSAMAMYDRDRYFAEIDDALNRRRKNKYFRWHVAGDILDAAYFDGMIMIAEKHPDFTFWTYTKRYAIVNDWLRDHGGRLPFNFKVMFSKWDGVEMDNPYNMPEFRVHMDGTSIDPFLALHKCPGCCDECKKDGGRGCIAGETSYADEH